MTAESYNFPGLALRVLLALLLLLPAAYLVTRAYAFRVGKTRLWRSLQILEAANLGPGRSLYLVRVGERLLVLGVTAHSVSLVAEITDPNEIAAIVDRPDKARPGGFGEILKVRMARERQGEDEK